jgi:hypothetical protein
MVLAHPFRCKSEARQIDPEPKQPGSLRVVAVPGAEMLLLYRSPPKETKTGRESVPSQLPLMLFAGTDVVSKDNRSSDERLSTDSEDWFLVAI